MYFSLIMSKVGDGVQDQKTAKEQFSAKFQQATNPAAKKRMKEQTLGEKRKVRFNEDQNKITEFLNVKEDNLILNYESDLLDQAETPPRRGNMYRKTNCNFNKVIFFLINRHFR